MGSSVQLKKHVREVIYLIKDSIDQDSFCKKCTTDMANDAGIGRNILQKGFKLLFESSIKEYRQQKRMEKAKDMLEEGRLSIKQVAYKCGYRSQGNFSSAFRNVFHTTPTEYQGQFQRA